MKKLALVVLLAWSLTAAADDRPIVAVFDIQVKSVPLKPDVVSALTDYLVARVAASGLYQVIPRDQIKARLSEQKKDSYKTCYDQSCQIDIGKELAANKALSVQILKVGKKCVITMTLYDLGRAATDAGDTAEGGCSEDDIMKLIRAAVDRLTGTPAVETGSAEVTSAGTSAQPPVAPTVTAELRWPPACPPDNPARCLEMSRELEIQGKNNVALLFAGMACGRAAGRKDWMTEEDASNQLYKLSKRYISNQADMERLLDGACKRGDSPACLTLAEFSSYNKQNERAFSLYARACALGNSTGCKDVGLQYKKGAGVDKNDVKRLEFMKKACEGGNMLGCAMMAESYLEGAGVKKDPSKAAEISRKYCDAGVMLACSFLGGLYFNGIGVPQDRAKAADILRLACDGGRSNACFSLGTMLISGVGVPKDVTKGAELIRRAAERGLGPFDNIALGTLYCQGLGVEQNYQKAFEHYRLACDDEVMWGCLMVGNLYFNGNGVSQDQRKAAELFRKACDGGEMWGCNNLGDMYNNGTIGTTDKAKAADLYRKACDGGIQDACNSLASQNPTTPPPPGALP